MYTVRKWNNETDSIELVEVSLEDIIRSPWSLNGEDLLIPLINHLREERGLEKLPKDTLSSVHLNGDFSDKELKKISNKK